MNKHDELIANLRDAQRLLQQYGDAPVLPDEVDEIVEQLRGIRDLTILECGHNQNGDEWGKYDHECVNRGEVGADLLERQAREIKQLKKELADINDYIGDEVM